MYRTTIKMKSKNIKLDNSKQFYLKYYLIYTVLFAVLALGVFNVFWRNGISLIHYSDSWRQHYKAFVYYSGYLKTIVHNLFTFSRPIIPQWDFNIGLGSDIITTFHYYALGDPLSLISVFVPAEKAYILFQLLFIVRIYLSGIVFSAFNFLMNRKDYFAVLGGTITYIFCGFTFITAVKHPYFMNTMMYLPLLFIGVELVLKNKTPALLVLAVGISAMSSFYFFYMYVIMTVVYVIFRLICIYKTDIRSYLMPLVRIAVCSVVGVMISAVVLLPVITSFLSDNRSGLAHNVNWLYLPDFYKSFPAGFISVQNPGNSICLCYSCIALICVAVLFMQRRKNTNLKIMLVFMTGLVMMPFVGKIMNGFSYATCRWAFVYHFLIAYIVSVVWPSIKRIDKSGALVLISVVSVYCLACFMIGKYTKASFYMSIFLLAAALVIIFLFTEFKSKKMKFILQSGLLCITALSVVVNAFFVYSGHGDAYSEDFMTNEVFPAVSFTVNNKIKTISQDDDSFFRYDGDTIYTINSASTSKLNGISYYWSMSNPYVSRYRREMNLLQHHTYKYLGFDNRTALNAFSCVKYFYDNGQSSTIPYGFKKTDVEDVYENQYCLPFGYTYDSYVSSSDVENVNSIALQQIMLSSAITDSDLTKISKSEPETDYKKIKFSAKNTKNASLKEDRIEFKKSEKSVEIKFSGKAKCETYLSISGLRFVNTQKMPLGKGVKKKNSAKAFLRVAAFSGDEKVVSKNLQLPTENYTWYEGLTDYDINLGYHKKPITSVKLSSDVPGTFMFDDLNIICQPMKKYAGQIEKLKQDVLTDTVFSTNTVSGKISLENPKLLCLSVPYADGWNLYVDGEKTEPVLVNGLYIGTELPAGDHEIQIVYNTPNLKLGAVISAFGFAALVGIGIVYQVQKRNALSCTVKKNKKQSPEGE